MNEIRADIAIVGAGVTGLLLTHKLSDLGYDVVLVEKQDVIGAGPSTKNEGWLHRGTYHATSISDNAQAIEVAKRCLYGHEAIRRFAPEAVEDIGHPTYAVVGNDEFADRATTRWEMAGVSYRPVTTKDFALVKPHVNTRCIKHIFEVGDVSINTRMLYHKLVIQSEKKGARFFLGSHIIPQSHGSAELIGSGGKHTLYADMFIITAGYGLQEMFREVTGEDLPVRYWKSHLLVFPRLTKSSIFHLEPGEVALFNHGKCSIVGHHEDAVLLEYPDFTVIPERARESLEATKRLIPCAREYEQTHMAYGCLKLDVPQLTGQTRSLSATILSANDYLFALPGKMTEAPYVADMIAQMVFNEKFEKSATVALRPCDIFKWTRSEVCLDSQHTSKAEKVIDAIPNVV